MRKPFSRLVIGALAAFMAVGLSLQVVDAKPGRSGSSGSRGARTDTSVPSTPTAPRTSTGAPSSPAAVPGRPAAPAAAQAPSRFSTMAKGFALGLFGAGLFGLLSGNGLLSGLSGIMGFLGLILQIGLIALAVRLVWGFFRNRQAQQALPAGPAAYNRAPLPETTGAASAQAASTQPQPAPVQRNDTVGIGPDDYQGFQSVLSDLMAAYTKEDIAGIRRVTTPQMAAHFIKELHENQSRGLVNQLGQPQLMQGDLAEAWYEDNLAYATVAMRFAMTDAMLERATGRVVSGNPAQPEESVEVWTFCRDGAGRPWLLSAQEQG